MNDTTPATKEPFRVPVRFFDLGRVAAAPRALALPEKYFLRVLKVLRIEPR